MYVCSGVKQWPNNPFIQHVNQHFLVRQFATKTLSKPTGRVIQSVAQLEQQNKIFQVTPIIESSEKHDISNSPKDQVKHNVKEKQLIIDYLCNRLQMNTEQAQKVYFLYENSLVDNHPNIDSFLQLCDFIGKHFSPDDIYWNSRLFKISSSTLHNRYVFS